MATVYRAYDPLFEREVAIKVLPPEFLHDPQFRTRFEREAKIIAALEHPAIVPVYDVGESDGLPYFVMRYMHGGSLADKIKEGPLSLEETARIIRRLAPALDQAHKKGIIHRDLKPGNILFDEAGEPYLSDFGIAKLRDSQINVTGSAIIGTPAYMSPEQAQGEAVDGRSDIYALGAILYKMLSGKFPYEADTPMGLVLKHITEPIPDILNDNPSLPPAVASVIYRAMAKKPDERYATVAELSRALDAVVQGSAPTFEAKPVQKPTEEEKAPPPPPPSKKKWIFAGIAALILLCAAGGLLFGAKFLPRFSPAATPTLLIASTGHTPTVESTPVSSPTPSPVRATETPIPATETPTPTSIPVLGGADKIAFISNQNVWLMNVDGSDLTQLTSDNAAKFGLRWLPDGQTLTYISGKCVWSVNAFTDVIEPIACYQTAQYLESFAVSPDGKYAAISMNRELFVVPFDLDTLKNATTRARLMELPGCILDRLSAKDALWSNDGTKLAVKFLGVSGNLQVDTIRVVDVQSCIHAQTPIYQMTPTPMPRLDEFPGQRFTMSGYNSRSPYIPSYDWNGDTFFVMNTFKRNEGFGYLYSYNTETHRAAQLEPIENACCYRDAQFSPDGTYLIFAYQDIRLGAEAKTQVYYVLFGSIGTGAAYQPIPLPETLFSNPAEAPQFALHPAP